MYSEMNRCVRHGEGRSYTNTLGVCVSFSISGCQWLGEKPIEGDASVIRTGLHG